MSTPSLWFTSAGKVRSSSQTHRSERQVGRYRFLEIPFRRFMSKQKLSFWRSKNVISFALVVFSLSPIYSSYFHYGVDCVVVLRLRCWTLFLYVTLRISLHFDATLMYTPGTGRSAPQSIRPGSIRPTSAPNAVVPPRVLGRSAPCAESFRPNTPYPVAAPWWGYSHALARARAPAVKFHKRTVAHVKTFMYRPTRCRDG